MSLQAKVVHISTMGTCGITIIYTCISWTTVVVHTKGDQKVGVAHKVELSENQPQFSQTTMGQNWLGKTNPKKAFRSTRILSKFLELYCLFNRIFFWLTDCLTDAISQAYCNSMTVIIILYISNYPTRDLQGGFTLRVKQGTKSINRKLCWVQKKSQISRWWLDPQTSHSLGRSHTAWDPEFSLHSTST